MNRMSLFTGRSRGAPSASTSRASDNPVTLGEALEQALARARAYGLETPGFPADPGTKSRASSSRHVGAIGSVEHMTQNHIQALNERRSKLIESINGIHVLLDNIVGKREKRHQDKLQEEFGAILGEIAGVLNDKMQAQNGVGGPNNNVLNVNIETRD